MKADTTPYIIRELKPMSFVYEIENAIPAELCDEMIARFEAHPEQHHDGRIGEERDIENSIKRSTDLRISGRDEWKDIDQVLFGSLGKALSQLSAEFPFFAVNRFRDMGYQLQRTREGEFYHWHIDSGPGEFSQRQLVAIWYLNDVAGPGGTTDFALQEISVQPQRGKMVLFPPFWTHIHRNATLEKGVKYIATTWVCFG
ncbi:MAG: 2OG-Fe(II) oxygenase [Granulosicoccaceae bacterium]|jgi:hypothetical protein